MCITHRYLDIFVPQKFLNRSDVVPGFEQMCGEGMPSGIETVLYLLTEPRCRLCPTHCIKRLIIAAARATACHDGHRPSAEHRRAYP
jgi:hypothetical protein